MRKLTYNGETGETQSPETSSKHIALTEVEPIEGKRSYEVLGTAPTTEPHRLLWTVASEKLPTGTNNVDAWDRFYFRKFANPKTPVTIRTWGNMKEGRYLELIVLENGKLQLKRNGSSVVGETAEVPNGKHYAELRLRHGSTTANGQAEARLDGESFAVNNACNLGAGLTYDELRGGICNSTGGPGEVRWQFDAFALNNPEGTEDSSWPGALSAEDPPVVVTGEADGLGGAIATLHGTVNPKGLPTDYWFEYGPTEAYGSKTAVVEAGDGEEAVDVEADLTGLDPETPYHFRLVAENEIGETQGEDAEFETGPGPSGDPVATSFIANHEGVDVTEEYGLIGEVNGTLTEYVPGYGGGKALLATVTEPDGFARGIATKAQTGWQIGQIVAYEIAFYLPKGFFAAKQGQVDISRWDNFEQDETTTERGGLVFHGEGSELRLVRIQEGEPDEQVTLVLGPEIKEERWIVAGVVQTLWHEDGLALSELWINGVKVGESTKRNCTRSDLEVSRLRDGIVATNSKQTNDISVVVDRVMAGPPPLVGPIPAVAPTSVTEPVDDRLFVKLIHADGSTSRWSGEEPDAFEIPQGIRSATSAPGGFRDASCSLVRDPRREWPDLNLVDDIVIYGRTKPLGRNAFEGQTAHFPSELGDGFSIGVNAVGHQVLLSEDESWRALYVALGFEGWDEAPLARREYLAGLGWPQGKIPASSGSGGLVWDPPNEELPLNESTGLHYEAPSGLSIAKVGYRGKRTGTWTNFEAAKVWGADDEKILENVESKELTLDEAPHTTTFDAAHRFLMIRAYVTGEVIPPAGTQQALDRVALYGDTGLTLREIEGGKELPGVYAHDALAHMLRTGAPQLKYKVGANGTIIPNKNFVMPDLAFLEPGTVGEAVLKLNAYFLNNYAVWEDKYFHWHPWNPEALAWDIRIEGGAFWAPAGRQAETLLNGIVVSYTDSAGVSRMAGPPGSGCDVESSYLLDLDPSNPYTRRGRKKWGVLQVDFPLAYASTAIQVGTVRLLENRMPQRSGTLVVRPLGPGHIPQIEHPTIGPVPIWAMRAGEYANLIDWPDPEPFRIIETDYDHDSKTLTAQLDNSSARISAIMERVGVRQVGVIG